MEHYITFRSLTTAQRASALLQRYGIAHRLQRTPKSMAGLGCGYSLKLAGWRSLEAVQLFREDGIAYQRVYQSGNPPTEVPV